MKRTVDKIYENDPEPIVEEDEEDEEDEDLDSDYDSDSEDSLFDNENQYSSTINSKLFFTDNLDSLKDYFREIKKLNSYLKDEHGHSTMCLDATEAVLDLAQRLCIEHHEDIYYRRFFQVLKLLDIEVNYRLGSENMPLLHHACENKWYKLIEYLAQNNKTDFKQKFNGESIFNRNDTSEFYELIKKLKEKYNINADPNDFDKHKPIRQHQAALESQAAEITGEIHSPGFYVPEHMVRELHGNYQYGMPPLHEAALQNNVTSANGLLSVGARRLNIIKSNNNGYLRAADLAQHNSTLQNELQKGLEDIDDDNTSYGSSDNDSVDDPFDDVSAVQGLIKKLTPILQRVNHDNIMIPHFRGINYLNDFEDKVTQREHYKSIAHDGYRTLYSLLAYEMCAIDKLKNPLSEIDKENLQKTSALIKDFWNNILCRKNEIPAKTGMSIKKFDTMAYYIQQRATNTASLATKDSPVEQDIWKGDIWPYIRQHKSILLKSSAEEQKYGIFFEPNTPMANPIISTGKTPQKAVAYALGASVTKINRSKRTDARNRPDGKAKYSELGVVYVKLIDYRQYQQQTVSDTGSLSYHHKINLADRYRNETELAFIGDIPQDLIIFTIRFPSFNKEWSLKIQKRYGLSKEQYDQFQHRYNNCPRPNKRNKINIFSGQWKTSYLREYGISRENHIAHQNLISALNTASSSSRVLRVLHEHKAAFSQMEYETLKKKNKLTAGYLLKYLKGEPHLKMIHEYRRIKSEIRIHLEAYYSKKIIAICHQRAKAAGKTLAFLDRDGKLYEYGDNPALIKTHLSSTKRMPLEPVIPVQSVTLTKMMIHKAPMIAAVKPQNTLNKNLNDDAKPNNNKLTK